MYRIGYSLAGIDSQNPKKMAYQGRYITKMHLLTQGYGLTFAA